MEAPSLHDTEKSTRLKKETSLREGEKMLSPTYSTSVIREINTRACRLHKCPTVFLLVKNSECSAAYLATVAQIVWYSGCH